MIEKSCWTKSFVIIIILIRCCNPPDLKHTTVDSNLVLVYIVAVFKLPQLMQVQGSKSDWKDLWDKSLKQASKLGCKGKDFAEVSSISFSLPVLVKGTITDRSEFIMASQASPSSWAVTKWKLAISLTKAWSLPKWLRISITISGIVPGGRYWRRHSSDSFVLNDLGKKKKELELFARTSFSRGYDEVLQDKSK